MKPVGLNSCAAALKMVGLNSCAAALRGFPSDGPRVCVGGVPALGVPVGLTPDWVNVGAGRVGIGPVGVYWGSWAAAPPKLIDAGGQGYWAESEAATPAFWFFPS